MIIGNLSSAPPPPPPPNKINTLTMFYDNMAFSFNQLLKRKLHWYISFKYVVLVILMDQAPQIKTKFDINIVRNFILKMRLFWCDLC